MLWVLSLHIVALTIWSAAALYVPVLLAGAGKYDSGFERRPEGVDSIARFVYTHIATPAALISITAGSVVFLINQSAYFWLLAKLTLVTIFVMVHAAMGLLVIRVEREQYQRVRVLSWLILAVLSVVMTAIAWIVLAKPATPEFIPWTF